MLLLLATPTGARDDGVAHGPDVFFYYELRIEHGRLFLLHETRWAELACVEIEKFHADGDGDGVTTVAEAEAFGRDWGERVKRAFRLEVQGRSVALGEPEVRVERHFPSPEDQERHFALLARGVENITDPAEYQGITDEFRVYLDFGFRPHVTSDQNARAWSLVADELQHPALKNLKGA